MWSRAFVPAPHFVTPYKTHTQCPLDENALASRFSCYRKTPRTVQENVNAWNFERGNCVVIESGVIGRCRGDTGSK